MIQRFYSVVVITFGSESTFNIQITPVRLRVGPENVFGFLRNLNLVAQS